MGHSRFIWQVILCVVTAAGPFRAAVAQAPEPSPTPSPSPAVPPPKISGYIQVRETAQEHAGLSATLNRARIGLEGALPSRFSYRLLVELEAPASARSSGTVSLRDAAIRWTRAPVSLWLGQFKTPFSREYVTSITAIETADRATVVDTLATKRDIGVMGDLDLGPHATLALGVFNGEGQNASGDHDSTLLWVARATARPLPFTTVGGSVARYGPDSLRYGGEMSHEQRGWLLRGEVIGQHRLGRPRDDYGWFALVGWRALPWLQLIGRQEDFRRPLLGATRRIEATTAGANVDFPGGRARLIVDWVSRKTGPSRTRRDALIAQLQVRF